MSTTTERNTQAVGGAERDAQTIYDIAMIREERADATREDVEFKAIALRNFQFVAAAAELVEAASAINSLRYLDEASTAERERLTAALANIEGERT